MKIDVDKYSFFTMLDSFGIIDNYTAHDVGLYRNETENYYVIAPANGIISSYDDLLNDYIKRELLISPQALDFIKYEIDNYGEYYNKAWQKFLKLASLK